MSRLLLAALLAVSASIANAQGVPGRDLLNLGVGSGGMPAALAVGAGGLWNPAGEALNRPRAWTVGAAAVSAPVDLGLTSQLIYGSRAFGFGTITVSLARAGVDGLTRTETDPQSVGGEIPYSTLLGSVGVARRIRRYFTAGTTVRWHTGTVDGHSDDAVVLDAGAIVDRLPWMDARVGGATFLNAVDGRERAGWSVGGDVRVFELDSLRDVRAGIASRSAPGGVREVYPFASVRLPGVTVRGGPVRHSAYGAEMWLARLAVTVGHAGYAVTISRDENGGGLGPTYEIALRRTRQ